MAEFLFVLYLFSGLVKQLFTYNPTLNLPIDFTGITIVFLILWAIAKHKTLSFNINKRSFGIIISFLAFWGWILFSMTYTTSAGPAISKSVLMATNFIPILFLSIYQRFNINLFLRIFGCAISVAALIFLPLFFFLLSSGYGAEMRTFIGGYLSIGLYLGLICITNLTSRKFKLINGQWNIYINFTFLAIMLALGARGPLVILVFCYLLYLFHSLTPKNIFTIKKNHLFPIVWAAISCILLLIVINLYTDGAIELLINRTIGRILSMGEDNSSLEREDFIVKSLQIIFASPKNFLFGTGIGSFVQECYGYDEVGSPHNIILEVWLELGLVGIILIGILFYLLFSGTTKKYYVSGFVVLYIFLNLMKSHSLPELRIPFTFFFLYSSTFNTKKQLYQVSY